MTENGDENGHYHNAIIWLESPQYNNAMGYRWMEESPAVSRGGGGSHLQPPPQLLSRCCKFSLKIQKRSQWCDGNIFIRMRTYAACNCHEVEIDEDGDRSKIKIFPCKVI